VDATRSVTSISCPTTTFCATGDGSGYAAIYAPVPSTSTVSQLTWNATGSLALILSDGTYDYVYGPNATPVEEISVASSTPTFMTFTTADSTWFTTNAAGDETGFYGYDAFGTLAFGIPTSAFGYAGQYLDATTGLSNMRARWYSPQTSEFTTVGPDLSLTNSAYVYVNDDPLNTTDATGDFSLGGIITGIGDFEGKCAYNTPDTVIGTYSTRSFNGSPSISTLECGVTGGYGYRDMKKHVDESGMGWDQFNTFIGDDLRNPFDLIPRTSNNSLNYYLPVAYVRNDDTEITKERAFVVSVGLPTGTIITAFASHSSENMTRAGFGGNGQ
jgi:RHS repeat-associated protein